MKQMRCSLACSWKTLRKAPALACTSSPCGCGHSALWPVAPLGTYSLYMVEASESMVRRRQPAAEGCPALSSRAMMHPLCVAARRCSYRVTRRGGEQRKGARKSVRASVGCWGSGDDFPSVDVGPPGSPCRPDGDEAF